MDFRPLSAEHPSARRMTVDLVQAGHLHRRSTLRLALPRGSARKHRQDASNPFLQPTFRVTSTRRNTTFGDLSTAAGEPAGSTIEDLSRPRRFRRSVEKDAGPPFDHPASNGRAIDGAQPASAHPAPRRFRGRGRTAAALSAVGQLCRANLWHPFNEQGRAAKAAPDPLMGSRFHRCASTPPTFARSRCLPPKKSPFWSRSRVTSRQLRPRWPTGADAARVHRSSKASTRPL